MNIAVDNDGNIWSFTGNQAYHCNHIDVISSSGQLIKRYNVDINTILAYGCFLLNNILYLGLGEFNPVYPNTLLPISFTQDSAIIGSPLAMPSGTWNDLASCNTGTPLSSVNTPLISDIKFYPNPANDNITIEFQYSNINQKYNISIFNINSQLLLQKQLLQQRTKLDISFLTKGVYILKINNNDLLEIIRFIKL